MWHNRTSKAEAEAGVEAEAEVKRTSFIVPPKIQVNGDNIITYFNVSMLTSSVFHIIDVLSLSKKISW